MRGDGMEDVIFAGSAARPARAHAEVALRIDNAERRAPATFNHADELEISPPRSRWNATVSCHLQDGTLIAMFCPASIITLPIGRVPGMPTPEGPRIPAVSQGYASRC